MRRANTSNRIKATRVMACLMAIVLAAGLVPVLPGMPVALAEEPIVLGSDPSGDSLGELELVSLSDAERGDGGQIELIEDGPKAQFDQGGQPTVIESGVEDGLEPGIEVQAGGVSVSNPRMVENTNMESGQVTTWDCVWFGSYPQTEVTSSDAAYASLKSANWDSSGNATVNGTKYKRISQEDTTNDKYFGSATYRYFRYEPIKWRVLEVNGSTALVLADKALDDQLYNANTEDVTWETTSVRSWLNGYGATSNKSGTDFTQKSFVGTAFSASEREDILKTNVVNANSLYYDTTGGNDTTDQVFFLAESEVYVTDPNTSHAAAYGFDPASDTGDEARCCKATDFAHAMGLWICTDSNGHEVTDLGKCGYWLRSPGQGTSFAAAIAYSGYVYREGYVCGGSYGVRPAMNLNLASSYIRAAGTVSSNDTSVTLITSVTPGVASYTYDGKAKVPTLKVLAGGEVVPESGYDVAYKGNVNAGTATVTVTGKGSYGGTATATFKILPASLSGAKVTGVKGRTYNGGAQTQNPTVQVGGRTLAKGTDYTLSYKKNTNVGSATMTITGKGNYTGTKQVGFTISPATNPMKAKAVKRTASLSKLKKKAQVVDAPLEFTKKAKGKVTYTRVAKGSAKQLTVSKKTGKVTVAKGTKKGTYKVRIKVSAAGGANYKRASQTFTCKVVVK